MNIRPQVITNSQEVTKSLLLLSTRVEFPIDTFQPCDNSTSLFFLIDVSKSMYKTMSQGTKGNPKYLLSHCFSFVRECIKYIRPSPQDVLKAPSGGSKLTIILFSNDKNEVIKFDHVSEEFIKIKFSKMEYINCNTFEPYNHFNATRGLNMLHEEIVSQQKSKKKCVNNLEVVFLSTNHKVPFGPNKVKLQAAIKKIHDSIRTLFVKSRFSCVHFLPPFAPERVSTAISGSKTLPIPNAYLYSKLCSIGNLSGLFLNITNVKSMMARSMELGKTLLRRKVTCELIWNDENSGLKQRKVLNLSERSRKSKSNGDKLIFENLSLISHKNSQNNMKIEMLFGAEKNEKGKEFDVSFSSKEIFAENDCGKNIKIFVTSLQSYIFNLLQHIHNEEEMKVILNPKEIDSAIAEISAHLNLLIKQVFNANKDTMNPTLRLCYISVLGEAKRIICEFKYLFDHFKKKEIEISLNEKSFQKCLFVLNLLCLKKFFPFKKKTSLRGSKIKRQIKEISKAMVSVFKKRKFSSKLDVHLNRKSESKSNELKAEWDNKFYKNGNSYFVGFEIDRGERGSFCEYTIKKIHKTLISMKEVVEHLVFTDSFKVYKEDVLSLNLLTYSRVLSTPVASCLYPLFLSKEHWEISQLSIPFFLSFLFHGSFNEYKKKYFKTIPFLLLSCSLKDKSSSSSSSSSGGYNLSFDDDLEAEMKLTFEEKMFNNILQTCMAIYENKLTSGDIKLLESMFHEYANDILIRATKIENTEIFLSKCYCAIEKGDIITEQMLFRDEFFLNLVIEELRRREKHYLSRKELNNELIKMLGISRSQEIEFYLNFLKKPIFVDTGYSFVELTSFSSSPSHEDLKSLESSRKRKIVPMWLMLQKMVKVFQGVDNLSSKQHYKKIVNQNSEVTVYYQDDFFFFNVLYELNGQLKFIGATRERESEYLRHIRKRYKGNKGNKRKKKRKKKKKKKIFSNSMSLFKLKRMITDEKRQVAIVYKGKVMIVNLLTPLKGFSKFPDVPKQKKFSVTHYAMKRLEKAKLTYHKYIAPLFFFKESFVDDFIYVPEKNNLAFLKIDQNIHFALTLQNLLVQKNSEMIKIVNMGEYNDPFFGRKEIIKNVFESLDQRKLINDLVNQNLFKKGKNNKEEKGEKVDIRNVLKKKMKKKGGNSGKRKVKKKVKNSFGMKSDLRNSDLSFPSIVKKKSSNLSIVQSN